MTTSTSQIEAYLNEVDPYEFEGLVAKIWEKSGYRTEVTSGSQDRGIDVVAEQDIPIKRKILIQVKAYSEENKISSNEVRKYATLYQQENDVDRVVLVTTSWFTTQAEELAQDLDVDAIDREDLIEWISEYEVDIGTEFEQSSQNNRSPWKRYTTPWELTQNQGILFMSHLGQNLKVKIKLTNQRSLNPISQKT